MHADRTNRAMLILLGALLTAGGTAGALLGFGVFGARSQHGTLFANRVGAYVGANGAWLWPAAAAVGIVLAVLALRWLIAILFSTDRAGQVDLTTQKAAGTTVLTTSAVTDAVSAEIRGYPGVHEVRTRLIGRPDSPEVVIDAALEGDADPASVRRRVESDAVPHLRRALDSEDLPVHLDLSVVTSRAARVR